MKRVIIIGGGASGMTAAVFAARQGARVTVLEHTDRVGKKILSTGNGKCNLSNRRQEADCYRSGVPGFPMAVLSQFGLSQTIAFFEDLGIVIKDRDGYLYPNSGQAASVLDVLREELTHRKVEIITECGVNKILPEDGGRREFAVLTSKGKFYADSVILSTGSMAAPSTGSDGSGYGLAKQLKLTVIKPLPALVQLRCRESFYKQIAGIRADAAVTLYGDGRILASDRGEVQLTDYGISGIPVFQVSRFAARALDSGEKVTAELNFCPELSGQELKQLFEARCIRSRHQQLEQFFTGWFNRKLGQLFLKLAKTDGKRQVKTLTETEKERLLSLIAAFRTEVSAVNPFANAQIACGGVDVSQIDEKTMEVKQMKGLFLTGELLDVDGICGGYNLQWAWSTGAIAGTHAGL